MKKYLLWFLFINLTFNIGGNAYSKDIYLDCYWVMADGPSDSSLLVTINKKAKYLDMGQIGTFAITEINESSIIAIKYATVSNPSREVLTATFDRHSGNLDIKGNKKLHIKFKCYKKNGKKIL